MDEMKTLHELQEQQTEIRNSLTPVAPFWLSLLGAVREVARLGQMAVTKPAMQAELDLDPRLHSVRSMCAGIGGVGIAVEGALDLAQAGPVQGSPGFDSGLNKVGRGLSIMAEAMAPGHLIPRVSVRGAIRASNLPMDTEVAMSIGASICFLLDLAALCNIDAQTAVTLWQQQLQEEPEDGDEPADAA